MSWLLSQVLVAEYSEDICLDGAQSALSNGTHTQLAFLPPDKMTEFSRLSRFGMTFRPLTEGHGAALLTSYLEGFHARTSALLAVELVSKVQEAECGSTWHASSVRFDPSSSIWKTAHCLWEEDLQWSSVILPRWGMTRSGFVYQHPTLERPINGTASGLWATPSASDGSRGGRITENMTGIPLAQQINTPERYPTPTVVMHKGSSKGALTRISGRSRENDRLDYAIEGDGLHGRLNPTWVEWLMGWPLGWTDLKPLAMGKFREWLQQHSPYSAGLSEAA